MLSPLSAALHVVDLILCFLSCTLGTWEVWFFSTKNLYLENLSYIKKQQEQAEAQTKNIIKYKLECDRESNETSITSARRR